MLKGPRCPWAAGHNTLMGSASQSALLDGGSKICALLHVAAATIMHWSAHFLTGIEVPAPVQVFKIVVAPDGMGLLAFMCAFTVAVVLTWGWGTGWCRHADLHPGIHDSGGVGRWRGWHFCTRSQCVSVSQWCQPRNGVLVGTRLVASVCIFTLGTSVGPLLSVCMFVQVAMATGGGAAGLHALIHADIGGVVEGL